MVESSACTFSEEAYNKTKEKIVKTFVQAYKHIHNRFGSEYSYLSVPVKPDKSNIFAIIVVADNPYLPQKELYYETASTLGIQPESSDYYWLCGHIGIVSMDLLEVQLFQRHGIMDTVKANINSGHYYDYWFLNGNGSEQVVCPHFLIEKLFQCMVPIEHAMNKDSIYLQLEEG